MASVHDSRKRYSAKKPWITCEACGKSVPDRKGAGRRRFCSYSCRDAVRASCPWPRRPIASDISVWRCQFCDIVTVRPGHRARRSKWCSERCYSLAVGRIPLSVSVSFRECRRCGKTFCHPTARQDECCSAQCTRAYHRRLREHIKRTRSDGENFGIREIAERDNWTCHLCAEAVPDKPWDGDIDCGTLDHLIPVSAGGKHIRANVKLAHFMCNSLRGATPLEDIHAEQGSFALSG